ncbi:hypothetical protein THAR02_08602 [Trichoderma harzianum]|uniref:Uncharacterized protein n=1 Tax=Trichoderma harzianum TaxID=5544 RepID=A0A0F9ZG37_TRIHA|nr:hypothetical protein THAR02_08602 [Trichoderma harzianum]
MPRLKITTAAAEPPSAEISLFSARSSPIAQDRTPVCPASAFWVLNSVFQHGRSSSLPDCYTRRDLVAISRALPPYPFRVQLDAMQRRGGTNSDSFSSCYRRARAFAFAGLEIEGLLARYSHRPRQRGEPGEPSSICFCTSLDPSFVDDLMVSNFSFWRFLACLPTCARMSYYADSQSGHSSA